MLYTFKKIVLPAVLAAFASLQIQAEPYKVRVQLTDDDEGAMLKLIDFDTKVPIDSVIAAGKVAVFTGEIDEPLMARIIMDGQPISTFILEGGSIVVDPTKRKAFGSMLNDQLTDYKAQANAIAARFKNATSDSEKQKIHDEYNALTDQTIANNIDNPIGYYLFLDKAQEMTSAEFNAFLAANPSFAKFQRVNNIKLSHAKKEATSVGCKFADFEVTNNGRTSRLSDYVGKGHYVLVDYWASWCGPCLRQIPVIKELMAEFGPKLQVLGVAVWDEPQNTEKAIESHGITWPCIIDAQTIPTDLYGITGIPCIILYGPDGTILSRDKQGDELKADVRRAIRGN